MNKVSIVFGLATVGLVALTIAVPIWAYYVYQYPIDQANEYVDLAAADNNLTEVLNDLNTTLTMLGPYHGNPNPLFPTSHTNFDAIKEQIRATVESVVIVSHQSPDNFSYQQALKNIQSDLTTTVEGELTDAGIANWWWHGGWFTIVGFVLSPMSFVLTLATRD